MDQSELEANNVTDAKRGKKRASEARKKKKTNENSKLIQYDLFGCFSSNFMQQNVLGNTANLRAVVGFTKMLADLTSHVNRDICSSENEIFS